MLLKACLPKEQVLTLQAINLSILLFAKRERALLLSSQYMLKLFELESKRSQKTAHLVLLALKARPQNYKVRSSLPGHSASAGNALAQIQLQVRLYTQSILQNQILCSFLEEAQARTSKSVAPAGKATTYPPNSAVRPV